MVCALHKFNLAVMNMIEYNRTVIHGIHALILVLPRLSIVARFREENTRKPWFSFPTRPGLYFEMLDFFMSFKDVITELKITSFDNLLPSAP